MDSATAKQRGLRAVAGSTCRRDQRNGASRGERGAAMIIAIAIMTILLAIAVTFFRVTRTEVQTATNVRNIVSVDLLTDAAIAIPQAQLNQDFFRHPNYTSHDHAWRTIFNGAAFAGKPWAMAEKSVSIAFKGLPEVDFTNLPTLTWQSGYSEVLFKGPRTRDWLAIPRFEGGLFPVLYDTPDDEIVSATIDGVPVNLNRFLNNPAAYPFILPTLFGPPGGPFIEPGSQNSGTSDGEMYPAEVVHLWADVDNDNDGLRDSIWIPIPADIFLAEDGVDNNLNGMIDERQDDGINNDLGNEGFADATVRFGDSRVIPAGSGLDAIVHDPDEALEAGVFVYWGGNDGLDNDGDGLIDQADAPGAPAATPPFEFSPSDPTVGYFLTAPLPGIVLPVDFNADGSSGDLVPIGDVGTSFTFGTLKVVLPNRVRVSVANRFNPGQTLTLLLGPESVDRLDNDYDLLVNDYYTYAYIGPNTRVDFPPFRLTGFANDGTPRIDTGAFNSYLAPNSPATPPPDAPQDYYSLWRLPGNWIVSVDGRYKDADLYAKPRERGYVDINTGTAFDLDGDGIPDLSFRVETPDGNVFNNPIFRNGPFTFDYTTLAQAIRITHSGEPVCELAGRAAILITDEASKVNMNVAGGHTYENEYSRDSNGNIVAANAPGPVKRALHLGATTAEYETRVLPGFGVVTANRFRAATQGAPLGRSLPVVADAQGKHLGVSGEAPQQTAQMGGGTYYYDVVFPGYGRTDDNGNALLLAFDGIDNNGDGLVDEGVRLPDIGIEAQNILTGTQAYSTASPEAQREAEQWLRYYWRLGQLEGIDEPGEYQTFSPLRHRLAEEDTLNGVPLDNDNDGVANEIGELADRPFNTRTEFDQVINDLDGVNRDNIRKVLRQTATLHSSDKSLNYVSGDSGIRAFNKTDYNYANAQRIAATLIFSDPKVRPVTDVRLSVLEPSSTPPRVERSFIGNDITRAFAEGLRQTEISLTAPALPDSSGGFLHDNGFPTTRRDFGHAFPADPLLSAMQTAAQIVDARDQNHARTVLTTEKRDLVANTDDKAVPWPAELNARERTPDAELLPLEELQQHIDTILKEAGNRRLQSIDTWWSDPAYNPVSDPLPRAVHAFSSNGPILEDRKISYTVSGLEAIVINEIMPRPVRRVEAEMIADVTNPAEFQLDPSPKVDPSTLAFSPDGTNILPRFNVRRNVLDYNVLSDSTYEIFPSPVSANPPWAEYPLVPDPSSPGSFITNPSNTLGPETWYQTNYRSLDVSYTSSTAGDPDDGEVIKVGNVIQYMILPSDGLPPGRYYLTVNIDNGDLGNSDDLQYAIKYVFPGGTTILQDIASAVTDLNTNGQIDPPDSLDQNGSYFADFWAEVPPAHYSGAVGEPAGWVFIDGTPRTNANPNFNSLTDLFAQDYYLDGGGVFQGPVNVIAPTKDIDLTHTVTVPTLASGVALCIAFRKLNDNNTPLAINFLDFSQEPDHEYIELANRSEKEVDLSNWKLEIGIPDAQGVPRDPFKSVWRVPRGTKIAPKGMLLLGFNKWDFYRADPVAVDTLAALDSSINRNLISTNGMGLASGGTPASRIAEVTMPPHGLDTAAPLGLEDGLFSHLVNTADRNDPLVFDPVRPLFDPTGSVFRRYPSAAASFNTFTDYIDNDGNGAASNYLLGSPGNPQPFTDDVQAMFMDQGLLLDTDHVRAETKTESTRYSPAIDGLLNLGSGPGPNKPWDRIVELQSEGIKALDPTNPTSGVELLSNIQEVDQLAALILRGGFLPNYPERDGYDNDGDGGYVIRKSGGTLRYVPGTLDKDHVDNDFDARIDERGPGTKIDENTDTYVELPNPFLSEGVDEGRYPIRSNVAGLAIVWRRYGAGSYDIPVQPGVSPDDVQTLPIAFFRVRNDAESNNVAPSEKDYELFTELSATGNDTNHRFLAAETLGTAGTQKYIDADFFNTTSKERADDSDLIYRAGRRALNPLAANFSEDAQYLGSNQDPPDWKAFVERRWYPGDNVIVSLYDNANRTVDRVTYREQDVTNRTIDDVAPTPYVLDVDGDGTPDAAACLDQRYQSFWLPDHMALDFYRALERKHPDYHGDRFGTTNRWEATDGNYDDWAESPSFFEGRVNANDEVVPLRRSQMFPRLASDFDPSNPPTGLSAQRSFDHERLFRHAMFGSPLRMNLTHRLSSNPRDMVRDLMEDNLLPADNATDIIAERNVVGADRVNDQFFARDSMDIRFGSGRDVYTATNRDWSHDKTEHRDAPFASAGDLLRLPGMSIQHMMVNDGGRVAAAEAMLHAPTPLNYIHVGSYNGQPLNSQFQRQDIAHSGATLGYDETNTPELPDMFSLAVNNMAMAPLVLTVGQAQFTPIRPNPYEMGGSDFPAGQSYGDLLDWVEIPGQPGAFAAPAAWAPVFLFELPGDSFTVNKSFGEFPYYPSFIDGRNAVGIDGTTFQDARNYLFNLSFLYEGVSQASFSANLGPELLAARWPLEKRAVMYVAEQRNISPSLPMGNQHRAEALFTWDAEDGLENGEYTLYIGTIVPGMAERLALANSATGGAFAQVPNIPPGGTDGTPAATDGYSERLLTDFAAASLLPRDATNPAFIPGGAQLDTVVALDVITDRTKARGLARRVNQPVTPPGIGADPGPGLIHPDDWNPALRYRPGADGYIFYGTSAEGSWKPIIVRVTDNFLALRVRNLGAPGQTAAITHVVLTPRKRLPGRVNINTADSRLFQNGTANGLPGYDYFNTMLGLPGVVNAGELADGFDIAADQALSAPRTGWANALNPAELPNIRAFGQGYAVPPNREDRIADGSPSAELAGAASGGPASTISRLQVGSLVQAGRAVDNDQLARGVLTQVDGRYYTSIADLTRDRRAYEHPYNSGGNQIYPLSNQGNEERRFAEVYERFRRMANLITARSDVFEIIATVQAGYGRDENADGRFNYRTNEEFVTTAETKARVVYERRSPSDTSDLARAE